MTQPPDFLLAEVAFPDGEEIFAPVKPNRRGEGVAWALAAAVALMGGVLYLQTGTAPALAIGFTSVFALAGVLITFGNWIDLKTEIKVSADQVSYRSPLRRVAFPWGSIRELVSMPAGKGWRVSVSGESEVFFFRTAMQISVGSSQSIPIGVHRGERLASLIRNAAALGPPVRDEGAWVCRRAPGQGQVGGRE